MVPHEDSDDADAPPTEAQPQVAPPPLGSVDEAVTQARTRYDVRKNRQHVWKEELSALIRTAQFLVGRRYVNNRQQVCRASAEDRTFLFLGLVKTESLGLTVRSQMLKGADMVNPRTGQLSEYYAVFEDVDDGLPRIVRPD